MMPSLSNVTQYNQLQRNAAEFDKRLEKGLNEFFTPKPIEVKTDDKEIELQSIKKVNK